MDFGSFYVPLRHTHVTLVATSVGLFALRWLGVLFGGRWPLRPAWRQASMAVDTLLLAAGAALWAGLALNPLRQHWLGVKLLLLLVYIGLGHRALRGGRGLGGKLLAGLAALAVVAWMAGVALRHHPLGWLA